MMDDSTTRALMATTEALGRLMLALDEADLVPNAYLAETARIAAGRLRPAEGEPQLNQLGETWDDIVRFLQPASTT